jgi:hypothetical protein
VSRRRNSGYAISLFAFQDIITSVSGVLIMVVLLLALELTSRTPSTAARDSLQATAAAVRAERTRLAAEAVELEAAVRDSEDLIRRATAAPASLVDGRLREAASAIASLRAELGALESASETVKKAEQEVGRSREKAGARERLLRSLEVRLENLRGELEKLQSGQSIAYSVPSGIDPAKGWICDVSGGALRLHAIAPPARRHTIELVGTTDKVRGREAIEALSAWIGGAGAKPEYILFLIRPSGVWFAEALDEQQDVLTTQVGIELIGEEHEILGPAGAGRPAGAGTRPGGDGR